MTTRESIEREVYAEVIAYIDGDVENGPRYNVPLTEADIQAEVDRRMALPITIMDLAEHRGLVLDEYGNANGAQFEAVGLDFLGGCSVCGATIAAYNACPSKSGMWKCSDDCIGDDGWTDVAEANADIFGVDEAFDDRPWGEQQGQVDAMERGGE